MKMCIIKFTRIEGFIQDRIDNGSLKVVEDYSKIESVPGELIMKVLAFDSDLEKIDRVSKRLSESNHLAISSSSRGNIEITHSDAQKGIALESIAEKLGVDMDEVMAIGDNLNDVSMLSRVGYPVAMENATDEVKAVANYITESNEQDGVGNAIIKYLDEHNYE